MIEAAARSEVEAGGLKWRILRVCSDDVRRRQQIMLLAVMPRSAEELMQEQQVGEIVDPTERTGALVALRLQRMKRNLDPEREAQAQATRPAIVRAGVEAVSSDDGATWVAVDLVAAEADHDPAASPARMWQGRLTPQTVAVLFGAIWSLSTDEGAAHERVERFRGGAAHAAPDASAGKNLRGAPEQPAEAVA